MSIPVTWSEYSGQTIALTITAADGSTLSYIRPSDDVIRDPDFPIDGVLHFGQLKLRSDPFLSPGITSGGADEVKIFPYN